MLDKLVTATRERSSLGRDLMCEGVNPSFARNLQIDELESSVEQERSADAERGVITGLVLLGHYCPDCGEESGCALGCMAVLAQERIDVVVVQSGWSLHSLLIFLMLLCECGS